jgi:opine dehydrogenase
MKDKIAVLGAGNGGQTLSAHLTMLGHSVSLYEHPDFAENINSIKDKNSSIELYGSIKGNPKIDVLTSDMGEALKDTETVYVVAPSFAQVHVMKEAVPHLKEGMNIIFIPGNFGSLEIYNIHRKVIDDLSITLAETDTLPYACRMDEPGKVNVWGHKKGLSIAALPGKRTGSLVRRLRNHFPIELRPLENVLEIGLSNLNMIAHCPTMLLNAGRIEGTQGNFRFYTDGVTPSVGKLQELVDSERIKVGNSFNLNLTRAIDWVKSIYPVEGNSMYELLSKNPIYAKHGSDAPKTVNHRYVTEDVPYLLVPMVSLASAAGIGTPLTMSIITLLSALTDRDFISEGRNLEKIGLSDFSTEEIGRLVETGGN